MAYWNKFFFILTISVLGLLSPTSTSQSKFYTKTGNIHLEASVPSFEEVKAVGKTMSAVLNAENGEIAALILVKGFRFKIALMEEHFNENYAESSTYPKATFKGEIKEFVLDKLTDDLHSFPIKGSLYFHGETVFISDTITVQKVNKYLLLKMDMVLNPEDFAIKIPKIIRKKVADNVLVSIEMQLEKR